MQSHPKHNIPWWKIDLPESACKAMAESASSRHITQGRLTEKLEKRLAKKLDVPYSLLCTNASVGLLMALMAGGIQKDDEVIVPNLTFVATAQAPLILGAKVVLVDVKGSRPVIDVTKVEKAITPKTKAIIAVHLNGRGADIATLKKIAQRREIFLIEDAVQAMFSKNSKGFLGTQSDIGVFSLGVTKMLTAINGGVIVTRKKKLYELLRKIRNHGMSADKSFYSQSDILGFNFKFNDIFASVGLQQLKNIEKTIKKHHEIYKFYNKGLKELDYLKIIPTEKNELPLWVEVICKKREEVIDLLKKSGIQAKPFSPNLCEVPYLEPKGRFDASAAYAKCGLILPCGSGQSMEDLKKVIKILKTIRTKI